MDNQQPSLDQMNNSVQCRICGGNFGLLTPHLRTHLITVKEYQKQFEGASILSKDLSECHSRNLEKQWQDPEYKSKRSVEVSKDMINRWADPEFRRTQSFAIGNGIILHPTYEERVKKLQSNSIYRGKGWRIYFDRKGRKFSLRSSWELYVAILLDLLDLNWEYEKFRFRDHENRFYTPDFYVYEFNSFLEVKAYFGDMDPVEIEYRTIFVYVVNDISIQILTEDVLVNLEGFNEFTPERVTKFDLGRFNDYPLCGSTAKRLEVRRYLESLPGIRYSLSMHSNMQTVSSDCVTEVAFGS